jgi:hypothetical protein
MVCTETRVQTRPSTVVIVPPTFDIPTVVGIGVGMDVGILVGTGVGIEADVGMDTFLLKNPLFDGLDGTC